MPERKRRPKRDIEKNLTLHFLLKNCGGLQTSLNEANAFEFKSRASGFPSLRLPP